MLMRNRTRHGRGRLESRHPSSPSATAPGGSSVVAYSRQRIPNMLEIGSRLGPYEILSPLGKGGMGEVYRARDPRLGREVAIKVLPDAFAKDAERLARFDREARVLPSLNHPHIAAVHGFSGSHGV